MDQLRQLDIGSGLQNTAESFLANAGALKELGYNTNQQLDYTEALNNALVVSGAKSDRAARVIDALGKSMAAGKLQGDNLNTVIEVGGRVAEVLAAQLGVGVNQLREAGKQGKITGDVIYQALTSRLQELTAEAESMPATISDGFQKIANCLMKFVGTMDQASGVSATIAQGLVYVGDNFEHVAVAAAAAAAVLLTQYVPAMARVALAGATMVATNPFLLLVAGIRACL
ncbi:tape measure protein [Brucellaceae bacterium D45D]